MNRFRPEQFSKLRRRMRSRAGDDRLDPIQRLLDRAAGLRDFVPEHDREVRLLARRLFHGVLAQLGDRHHDRGHGEDAEA